MICRCWRKVLTKFSLPNASMTRGHEEAMSTTTPILNEDGATLLQNHHSNSTCRHVIRPWTICDMGQRLLCTPPPPYETVWSYHGRMSISNWSTDVMRLVLRHDMVGSASSRLKNSLEKSCKIEGSWGSNLKLIGNGEVAQFLINS